MNTRAAFRWIASLALTAVTMWPATAAANDRTAPETEAARPAAARPATAPLAERPAAVVTQRSRPAASPEQIAAWIAKLDDNRYLVREEATQRLLELETDALDPLLAVANAELPEPADRAVWLLRRIANTKDAAVRRQALERLVLLRDRPTIVAAAHDALAQLRHNEALQAVQQLGGKFTSPYADAFEPYMAGRVIIDHQWRGGDAGLVHLRHLLGLRHIIIIGTDISLKGVYELQHVATLSDLWLYGTKLQPENVPKIQAHLPQVVIDYRRGALLGVGSNTMEGRGPAVVGTVQGVAAAAGIQIGDIIQKFEDQPVPDFKTLTTMIGKHAAGDEVTMEVLRGGHPIQFKLKLGQWETYNF